MQLLKGKQFAAKGTDVILRQLAITGKKNKNH